LLALSYIERQQAGPNVGAPWTVYKSQPPNAHGSSGKSDGGGFHEIHVNTMEGSWSLLRSWLRPHRGVAQEKPPLYLAFFQFVHKPKKRGKARQTTLVEAIVATSRRNPG
jgi:hypothetical protein